MVKTYTLAEVEAAMCLWESMLDWLARNPSPPFTERKNRHGMAELRSDSIELVAPCEEAWQLARKGGFDDSFDWEFCPWFLANCVDWEQMQPMRNWPDIVTAKWPSA